MKTIEKLAHPPKDQRLQNARQDALTYLKDPETDLGHLALILSLRWEISRPEAEKIVAEARLESEVQSERRPAWAAIRHQEVAPLANQDPSVAAIQAAHAPPIYLFCQLNATLCR